MRTQVAHHVHLVRGARRARFPEANSLLIDDELLVLVDAGAAMAHIRRALYELDHTPEDLDMIVLSHFHIDHKGHAAELHRMSDCEVLCHPLAEKGVRTFEGMVDYYGTRGHRLFEMWRHLIREYLPHTMDEYEVTGHFSDGRPIDCGETELLPVHAPGHTLDHTVFGIDGTDMLFLVDIDLTRFGPWYGNRVSDIAAFEESIERVIALAPRVGISGHLLDPVTDDLVGRLTRYCRAFEEREARILEHVARGYDTVERLASVPIIYPRIPQPAYLVFEEMMLQKHIERLQARGLVDVEGGRVRLSQG